MRRTRRRKPAPKEGKAIYVCLRVSDAPGAQPVEVGKGECTQCHEEVWIDIRYEWRVKLDGDLDVMCSQCVESGMQAAGIAPDEVGGPYWGGERFGDKMTAQELMEILRHRPPKE